MSAIEDSQTEAACLLAAQVRHARIGAKRPQLARKADAQADRFSSSPGSVFAVPRTNGRTSGGSGRLLRLLPRGVERLTLDVLVRQKRAGMESQGFEGAPDTPSSIVYLNGVPHTRKPLRNKAPKRPKRGNLATAKRLADWFGFDGSRGCRIRHAPR